MNIKIFIELFFKFDSQNLILDHIITCIYGLLKKHILTLIKENEKQENIYKDIKFLIFQCVNKRYLNLDNPSYTMKNKICDCISILIISGITHSWKSCIEDLIKEAENNNNKNKAELIYLCLRSIADCNSIINLKEEDNYNNGNDKDNKDKNNDRNDNENNDGNSNNNSDNNKKNNKDNDENGWEDDLNFEIKQKIDIKEQLMSKGRIIFEFIYKVYININQFEKGLKNRIIEAIIDLIIFWTQFDLNILTNNDISTILIDLINHTINEIQNNKEILKNVAELVNAAILSSQNCRLYEFYAKIEESDSPDEIIQTINNNINLEEKKGIEKWLDFIISKLEQYKDSKNKNIEILWPLAKMFSSMTENYIYLFLDLNNRKNEAIFKWLRIFISDKRIISWMFFSTIENMMIFITDYFRFYSYDDFQKNKFCDYLMSILLSIMENCSYKHLKENDFSDLQKEILFQNNESDWNTESNNNYINTDDNDIQLSDIDINGYRNSAEEVFYSIVTIFKSGFNANIYELNFYNKLLSLVNINNNINNNQQNEISNNLIKLDVLLFTLKSMMKALNIESNPNTFNLINEYIYNLQNSVYIQNVPIFIDYLLLINQFSPFVNEKNIDNIFQNLLLVSAKNNNQILVNSCYIIIRNICREFKANKIYNIYFDELFRRYNLICDNYSLNDISALENLIRAMFHTIGINEYCDNFNENGEMNNNYENELISFIERIIEPILFKRIIEKQNDRLKIKNGIIIAYTLYKEIFYHISLCNNNIRKNIMYRFITNFINDLINNSQSYNKDVKIFNLFPDDEEIINPIIDFYLGISTYLSEDCISIFNEINNVFILLFQSNIKFFKIIEFLGSLYKYILQNMKEDDNNYSNMNKYIIKNFLFIIKYSISYISSEKEITSETLFRINLFLTTINDYFSTMNISGENINIFDDIIPIIKFLLDIIDLIVKLTLEEINDKFISDIMKNIYTILNNEILNIISNILSQSQKKEFIENILDKIYKLLSISKMSILSLQILPKLLYQIIYLDVNIFNTAFGTLLLSTKKIESININNIAKYIHIFYENKNNIIEFLNDILSIITNNKKPDCLNFYFIRLNIKK